MTAPVIQQRALLHRPIGGILKEGLILANGIAVSIRIPIAGALKWKLRLKFNAIVACSISYVRAGRSEDTYTTPAAITGSTVANTEKEFHDNDCYGESAILLTMTPAAAATVAYADVCALGPVVA